MAIDYSEFVELARELIADSGRSVAFQRFAGTAADPAKPWKGAGVPTVEEAVTTIAVFLPVASASDLGLTTEDDSLFKTSEQLLLVAPPAGEQDLAFFHAVLDDGVRWKIEVTHTLKPGPMTVLYAMGVKR